MTQGWRKKTSVLAVTKGVERKNWLSALEICVSGHIFRVLGRSKGKNKHIKQDPQICDTRKTSPSSRLLLAGMDGWMEFVKLLTKNFGASRYYLFRSLLGKTISGPECLEKGSTLCGVRAEANCSGGSCTTVAPCFQQEDKRH